MTSGDFSAILKTSTPLGMSLKLSKNLGQCPCNHPCNGLYLCSFQRKNGMQTIFLLQNLIKNYTIPK